MPSDFAASAASFELTAQARALSAPLGQRLLALGAAVASCESCTSGLVAEAISFAPGASGWLEMGFVCYSERAKTALAGVDPALFQTHGVVSPEVALAMAQGAARAASCRFGVATTGLAGPGGASGPLGELPQGWVCLAAFDALDGRALSLARRFEGSREEVRAGASLAALRLLLELASSADPDPPRNP